MRTAATTHTRMAAQLTRLAVAYDEAAPPEGEQFTLPEELTELTDEELAAAEQQAVTAFDEVREGGDLSEAALTAMEQLADAVEALRGEQARRAEAQEAAATRAQELAARLTPEVEEQEEPAAAEQEEAPAAEQEAPTDELVEELVEEQAPEPIAAASHPRTVSLRGIRRQAPDPQPRPGQGVGYSITAAADVPGLSGGQSVNMTELGAAFLARARSLRAGSAPVGLATIRQPVNPALHVDGTDATAATDAAVDESRLPGGSLVAAGSWCNTPEVDYSLCAGLESMDGMVDLPTVTLSRGSVQVFGGFNMEDMWDQSIPSFAFDKAEDEAGEYGREAGATGPALQSEANTAGDKSCVRIPCLTPTTIELAGEGLCVEGGVLQARFAPEQVGRWLDLALAAYRHQQNAARISDMVTASTAVTMGASDGATAHLLGSVELIVEHMRSRYRTSRSQTFEALLPQWVHAVVRSDLSKRLGVDLLAVTDQQINGWFGQRGIRPQFVTDWQVAGASAGGDATLGDTATVPTRWPEEVEVLIYPAGRFTEYTSPEIDLNIGQDSQLAKTNDVNHLFVESFRQVNARCFSSYNVTIPLCPDGSTQGGVDLGCDRP